MSAAGHIVFEPFAARHLPLLRRWLGEPLAGRSGDALIMRHVPAAEGAAS